MTKMRWKIPRYCFKAFVARVGSANVDHMTPQDALAALRPVINPEDYKWFDVKYGDSEYIEVTSA